jgi:hypothetical protein
MTSFAWYRITNTPLWITRVSLAPGYEAYTAKKRTAQPYIASETQ